MIAPTGASSRGALVALVVVVVVVHLGARGSPLALGPRQGEAESRHRREVVVRVFALEVGEEALAMGDLEGVAPCRVLVFLVFRYMDFESLNFDGQASNLDAGRPDVRLVHSKGPADRLGLGDRALFRGGVGQRQDPLDGVAQVVGERRIEEFVFPLLQLGDA
eukprot:CAMPEP_0197423370 /NCGR_PEP_ID=MMETSP1170-20131217/21217_1 /TAXON_ID=54406 /ORGANISM="Sarcinochrysis sp, Strain CCMP770" /LENGTH=162 /DNA_ID=CAMNT_0042950791 /DNA_START=129 /DNA_END=613 /DNA_ORIENTATION=+